MTHSRDYGKPMKKTQPNHTPQQLKKYYACHEMNYYSRDKLVALPIKGESFYLHRYKKHILVDSGFNSTTLASALKSELINVEKIDITVCTHADLDHAGGFKDILPKKILTPLRKACTKWQSKKLSIQSKIRRTKSRTINRPSVAGENARTKTEL
jgi:metal-dependent hydrolase (beta-lactamase superfamily II)